MTTRVKDIEGRPLTTGDVARRYGVSRNTVCHWIDSGMLEGRRVPGSRQRRVEPADLARFAAEHGIVPGRRPPEGRAFAMLPRR